ncbi:hypothetical protein LguiA_009723 [Lonicera macranthoides]
MDRIHDIMNVVLPLVSLLLSIFILPPFVLFKLFYSLFKSISKEDVAGKVVLITGASSGIGEHIAYEYARRRACLVLVARREERLRAVADKARKLGSPDVIFICADVSMFEDCKRFVDESINHFGRLDHLVNNAGIAPASSFEEYKCVADHTSVMNINFWGSVYSSQFALPHLRKSKGKIIVIASCAGWLPSAGLSIYGSTKAAQIKFFETLRIELGSDIGITIVTPGLVESEITHEEFISKTNLENVPLVSTERCAKAIVNGTIRGDRDIMEPGWARVLVLWRFFCPEVLEFWNPFTSSTKPKKT